MIQLWDLAPLGTTHSCVARIVGTLVKHPAVRRGFAGEARPHKRGWDQAGPHRSRSLGEEQGTQGYQGWSPSHGNCGIFSLPSAFSSVQTSLGGSSETTSLVFRPHKLMGPKPPEDRVLPRVVQNLERSQYQAQPRSPVPGGMLEPPQLIQTGFSSRDFSVMFLGISQAVITD